MPYEHSGDDDLDRSTNKVMFAGTLLMFVMILIFPLYRSVEPSNRDEARATQLASLTEEGDKLFDQSCASCHGVGAGGDTAPALNAKQFLQAARDDQIGLLISVGVPGTQMDAWSQDFGGAMTSEQIKSIVTYLRSLEADAPDNPNWRTPLDFTGLFAEDLFTEGCSRCHGSDRSGVEDSGPDISSTSLTMDESDEFLIDRITNGFREMPQFGQALTPDQIDSLVAFLRGVEHATTTTTMPPSGTDTETPASTTTTQPETADADQLAAGKNIFDVTAGGEGCASCHGFEGKGTLNGPNIIGLSKSAISTASGGGVPDMDNIKLTSEELDAVYLYIRSLNS